MPKFYARRRLGFLAAFTGLIASAGLLNGPAASAALPTPVSAATARTYLASLTVASEDRTGYDRDLFPHWITRSHRERGSSTWSGNHGGPVTACRLWLNVELASTH
ncbi:hypothetical protein STENM327S_02094 [Streptomyces tendae]